MTVQLATLPSGLRVITAQLPDTNSATVSAFIDAGSRDEQADENGIAHFVEHMAFKGTHTRSARAISAAVETLGSEMNAYTGPGSTAYFVDGLSSTAEHSVAIIGDVLTNSLLDPAAVETEKLVILQEIAQAVQTSPIVALLQYGLIAYPGQALGRPTLGPPNVILSTNAEQVRGFMRRCYTSKTMIVVGVGDLRHDAFVQSVAEHFAGLPTDESLQEYQPACWGGGCVRSGVDRFAHVNALIGWQSVSEFDHRIHAHRMLATALGGGLSSPLFHEVRERRGLAYSIASAHVSGSDYGELVMSTASAAPESLDAIMSVCCDVCLRATETITDDDMNRARSRERMRLVRTKRQPFSYAQHLATRLFDHGWIVTPEDEIGHIDAVTKADLIEAARTIFRSTPTVSLVGPVPDTDYMGMMMARLG